MSDEKLIVLGTHDDFIHTIFFSPTTRSIRRGVSTPTRPHPSWLVKHPTHQDIVYANSHTDGMVMVYRLSSRTGALEKLEERSTGGSGPTNMIVLLDASGLVVANYNTGDTVHIPLLPSGMLERSKDAASLSHFRPEPVKRPHWRQEGPHPHQVILGPENDGEVIVPDLGSDKVFGLRKTPGTSPWEVQRTFEGFEPGDGPRHSVIHPDKTHLYTLCELSSTLVTHALSDPSTPISRIPIIPLRDQPNAANMLAAEIVLLPSLSADRPHLLLATNRDSGHPDGDKIAVLRVDTGDGVGRHLRGMAPDPSGRWIMVAGRDEGGLTIFERTGASGDQLRVAAKLDLDKVVCPLWC